MPFPHLEKKVAVVTGASRGLGRHIARALAREGARLALFARSQAPLEELAAELERERATVVAIAGDVSRREDLERLVTESERALGPVDIVVNNAGMEEVMYFHEVPLERMRETLEINLLGPMTLARLVLPGMVARGAGHIVNVSSLAGKAGPPLAESYAASKGGLIAFTQSLRASYHGTGVSASAVCPGFVRDEGMFADRARSHDLRPPALLGSSTPEQVADAVLDALRDDRPEIVVNPGPTALLAAAGQLFPRLPEWLIRQLKVRDLYRALAAGRKPTS
jgi:short-subunit dehydrogenase